MKTTFNVPLRKGWRRKAPIKRAKRAVNDLKHFLERHMKSDEIKIGRHLNEHIWKKGIKNPPHHVEIDVVKEKDGKVLAELKGKEFEKPVKQEKAPETMAEKLKQMAGPKTKEPETQKETVKKETQDQPKPETTVTKAPVKE